MSAADDLDAAIATCAAELAVAVARRASSDGRQGTVYNWDQRVRTLTQALKDLRRLRQEADGGAWQVDSVG